MPRKSLIGAVALFALGSFSAVQANEVQSSNGSFAAIPNTGSSAYETMVRTDFRATWDELINELAGRDFTINTLIVGDRTIRVTFRSDVPSRYVDCGEITVHSKNSVFGERKYKFQAANSVRYLVADEVVNELVDVERRTALNALANIKLTPTAQGTLVRVEADYALKVRTREFGSNITPRTADEILQFTSGSGGSIDESVREGATSKLVTVQCEANGRLERKIASVLGDAS